MARDMTNVTWFKVSPWTINEGQVAIIDGQKVVVDRVTSNEAGTWVHFNDETASRHFKDHEVVTVGC